MKAPVMVEPLTKRELEILTLLEASETNSEIAARLNLSLNSVKWYARQIFGKLGVENRRQAVVVAKELGILSTVGATLNKRTSLQQQHNLPLRLSSFIGREADIVAICRLINVNRLVTLTGSGGAGKTSLSLRVAETLLPAFSDGVWLVELAPINDPSLIPSAIARSLGMTLEGQTGAFIERLCEALKPRQMILLLDNCEHMRYGTSKVAEELLQSCPHLNILATSREKLGVSGELSYRVPSLTFPERESSASVENDKLMQYESVRLFVDRVRLGDPTFVLSESDKSAVARICQRLDGIPLAIELAAARTNVLRVEQIAEKLEENIGLLANSSRSVIPRHQTLRATIDWSYGLLDNAERAFLRRLSVFVGGFSLESAQHVAWIDDTPQDEVLVLDLLSRLVDKSLVLVIRSENPEPRYRILETVRQYLHEKVNEAGESEAIRKNHIAYYIQLVETAEPFLIRKEQLYWMRLLDEEHDNLRETIHWAQENGEVASALRIVGALRVYMERKLNWEEHVRWATSTVKLGREAASLQTSSLLAKALLCAGSLYEIPQNPKESLPFLEEALQIFRIQNDRISTAITMTKLSIGYYYDNNFVESSRLISKALELFQEEENVHGIGDCLVGLSVHARLEDNMLKARSLAKQAVVELERAGDIHLLLIAQVFMVEALWYEGETAQARAILELYLTKSREYGGDVLRMHLATLSRFAALCGDYEEAKSLTEEEVYLLSRVIGVRGRLVNAKSRLGEIYFLEGNLAKARAILEEAIREGEMLDSDRLARQYYLLGNVAFHEGSVDEADMLVEKCTLGQLKQNVRRNLYFTILSRGNIALARGDCPRARLLFQQSLTIVRDWNMIPEVPARLEALAQVAVKTGEFQRATYLLAAASSLRDRLGTPLPPVEREGVRACQEMVQRQLDPTVIQDAQRWGVGQTVNEMIAVGLDEADQISQREPPL